MKVKFISQNEPGCMLTQGQCYVVYWIETIASETFFGCCSDDYELMQYPVAFNSDDFNIVEGTMPACWSAAKSIQTHSEIGLTIKGILIAHTLHISEEKETKNGNKFFIERVTDGDVEASQKWNLIKREIDSFG